MSEIDLTEAIEAAARALCAHHDEDFDNPKNTHGLGDADKLRGDYRAWAKGALAVAAPLIERQVRERASQELMDWAETFKDGRISGERATLRRHIITCARRIAPRMTIDDVREALERGDYVVCALDDAGHPIARGGQP